MCRAEVQKDPEIRPMLNAVLTSDCYKDENLNCVVVDLDFYVSRFWEEMAPMKPVAQKDVKYWMYSPGENARKWNDCTSEGVMCLGWDEIGNLQDYESRETMRDQMRQAARSAGGALLSHFAAVKTCTEPFFQEPVIDGFFFIASSNARSGRGVSSMSLFEMPSRAQVHRRLILAEA